MKRPVKIIIISLISIISVFGICLIAFGPYGLFTFIGAIFAKNYNDDEPFSKNGLFIYENDGEDNIDINRIEFTIKEYQKDQQYEVVFKSSKNGKYGIDLALTIDNVSISDYSVSYLRKEKNVYQTNHYYYLYYFELKTETANYIFDLTPRGEDFLTFSFDEPIKTRTSLKNEITL